MTSLSYQAAIQKNEMKLSSFVEFENKMVTYCALKLNKAQPRTFELFKGVAIYKVTPQPALFSDYAWLV